jgi:hypothetical protein
VNPHRAEGLSPQSSEGIQVWWADTDEEIESPGSQYRWVNGLHEIGGTYQQLAGPSSKFRNRLQEFVDHPGGGGAALPRRRDLVELVDEDDDVFEMPEFDESFTQLAGEATLAARQLRWQQLHEGPLKSAREASGEGGLAGSGRAEHQHGPRESQPHLGGDRWIREWCHDPLVDQRLLSLHPREL